MHFIMGSICTKKDTKPFKVHKLKIMDPDLCTDKRCFSPRFEDNDMCKKHYLETIKEDDEPESDNDSQNKLS